MRLFHYISLTLIAICGAFIGIIVTKWSGTLGECIFFGIVSVVQIIAIGWSDDIFIKNGEK